MNRILYLGLILLIIAGLHGCGAVEEEGAIVSTLASIVVSPSNVTFAKDSGYYQFTATGYDQFGQYVFINPTWSALDEAGTIDQTGLLTISSEAGSGNVKAYVGTIEGVAAVTVTNGTLQTINISPTSLIIYIGNQQQFTATGTDSLPTSVSVYPNWAVDPGDIGNIGLQSGLFIPIASGEGWVKASQAGITASVEVTVNTPPTP